MALIKGHTGESGEAPAQHSQPSRKGKKAWRKNVDVTEVQKGLADLNEEIIRGGVIKEKASDDLFVLDTKGDKKISQKFPKFASKKGLKADEIINARSAVPAVSMRKRSGDNRTSDGLVPAKRARKDWVSHKDLARLKQVADGQGTASVVTHKDATYDIWGAPEEETEKFEPPTKMVVKAPKTIKQTPISLLKSGKQAPAVAKPSGGYSYNPDFRDYEERFTTEGQKAVAAEQKRLADEEAERLRLEALAKSAAEADAADARAELSEWEEDSEWEGVQSGVEDDKPEIKKQDRKTHQQKMKTKRRKAQEAEAKHKAAMKARRQQEQRIKEIAEEVDQKAAGKAVTTADSDADDSADAIDADNKLRRKQLGKYKLPEKDLELVLPDELQDSLRLLKPEGNLLKDRYRSMLVRGKVESRKMAQNKQGKKKLTEKWTHKDFVL